MSQFVIAKKNIKTDDQKLIEKNDVGILESSQENPAIFFIRIGKKAQLHNSDIQTFDVKKTGDGFRKKICNVCHKLLNTSKFARNQNGVNNRIIRRPSCWECRKHLEGTNMTPKDKREWMKHKPNNEPFECPICGKRTIAGVTSKVVLDHDHRDGKVRGWICDSCNTGIGRFKDDIEIVKRAIQFLG